MGITSELVLVVAVLVLISNLLGLSSCQRDYTGQYSCQVDSSATWHQSGNQSLAPAPSPKPNYGRDEDQQQHRKKSVADAPTSSTGSGSPAATNSSAPHPPPDHHVCILRKYQICAYIATEFMMACSTGKNMDSYDSTVAGNGPPPQGGRKAYLDGPTEDLIKQMALQSIDQLRTVKEALGSAHSMDRPAMSLDSSLCAELLNNATGKTLWPAFDCYKNSINTLLTSYYFQGMLSKFLVGALDKIDGPMKMLVGSLAAAKASQEAVIRTLLYQKLEEEVFPYKMSVADCTNYLSQYRDKVIGAQGVSDEGLWVPSCLGTGGNCENIFSVASTGLPYYCSETRVMECFKPFLSNYNEANMTASC